MSILLLTGPPAAGKNTVGELTAKHCGRCAVVDVEALREMIVRPQKAPWAGEEGYAQQRLSVTNATAITRNFADANFDVIILDVLTEASLALYREQLVSLSLFTVQLLPREDEIAARLLSRPDYLSRGEAGAMYLQQQKFDGYDERLDNSEMKPEAVVTWLTKRWQAESR